MNNEIVIVRYHEELEWTKFLKTKTTIYNKGKKIQSNHKIINVPNLGMGIGLYLYHIVENYDNLADITLFIQGWPFDGEFEQSIGFTSPSENIVDAIEEFYFTLLDEHFASYNCFMMPIKDIFYCPPNYNQRTHKCFIYHSMNWSEWLQILDPAKILDFKEPHRYYRNNHISLRKEAIKSNSKEYYIMLLEHCKYLDPLLEWFAESSIAQIFNIADDGSLINLRHDLVDVDNLKDYKTWMYEINE